MGENVGGVRDWGSYVENRLAGRTIRRAATRGREGEREKRSRQREAKEGWRNLGRPADRPEGTVRLGSIECSVTREENANARVQQTARRHVRASKRIRELGAGRK